MKKIILIFGLLLMFNTNSIHANDINYNKDIATHDNLKTSSSVCKGFENKDPEYVHDFNEYYNTNCASKNDDIVRKYILILAIVFLLALITNIVFRQKNKKIKLSKEVSFPDSINLMEVAYYTKSYISADDIAAMILYLGEKGYLKISVNDENQLVFIKQKEIVDSESKYAKEIFNMLFHKNKDIVNINKPSKDFIKNYFKIKRNIIHEFDEDKKIFSMPSRILKTIFLSFITLFWLLLIIFMMIYASTEKIIVCLGSLVIFGVIIYMSKKIAQITYKNNKINKNDYKYLGAFIAVSIILTIMMTYTMSEVFFILPINGGILTLLVIMIVFVVLGIYDISPAYKDTIIKCKSLKNTLKNTEIAEIDQLVSNNKNYYFEMLPYIYLFGITDKFINKLEKQENIPEWIACFKNIDGGINTVLKLIDSIERDIKK